MDKLSSKVLENQDQTNEKRSVDPSDAFFLHTGEPLFEKQDPSNEKLLDFCTTLAVYSIQFSHNLDFLA